MRRHTAGCVRLGLLGSGGSAAASAAAGSEQADEPERREATHGRHRYATAARARPTSAFAICTLYAVPGSGVGLNVVKRIVETHGGTVSVDSAARAGTCFTVRLPAGPVS